MNLGEKVAKLLIHNEKKIRSIGELERALGTGVHTIRKAIEAEIKEGKKPTTALQGKIVEGLGVKREWWETGKGDMFESKLTLVKNFDEPGQLDYLPLLDDLWDIIRRQERDNNKLKQQLSDVTQQLKDCQRKADHQ